ncbi:MAG: hypothetical protein ACI4HI_01455 [Lachnospiraceae bacterium]
MRKRRALKGSYTLEMTLLLPVILGVLSVSILGAVDLCQQCEKAAEKTETLMELEAAENFRHLQMLKKTADALH